MLTGIWRNLAWVALGAYTSLLIWLSLRVPSGAPQMEGVDKVHHFLAYGGLMVLLVFTQGMRRLWICFAGACLFGAFLEVAQAVLTSFREPSALDALANAGGAGLASILLSLIERLRR